MNPSLYHEITGQTNTSPEEYKLKETEVKQKHSQLEYIRVWKNESQTKLLLKEFDDLICQKINFVGLGSLRLNLTDQQLRAASAELGALLSVRSMFDTFKYGVTIKDYVS